MRAFMAVAAFLGSIIGFGVTVLLWKGTGKEKRAKKTIWFSLIAAGLILIGGFVVWVIDPDTARTHEWAESVREFLIDPGIWVNLIMGLLSFFWSGFLVSA